MTAWRHQTLKWQFMTVLWWWRWRPTSFWILNDDDYDARWCQTNDISPKSSNLWLKMSTFALNFTYTYIISMSSKIGLIEGRNYVWKIWMMDNPWPLPFSLTLCPKFGGTADGTCTHQSPIVSTYLVTLHIFGFNFPTPQNSYLFFFLLR